MAKSLFQKLGQMVGVIEKASPEEYAPEIIDAMAEEMPPREGVWWAVLSGKEVDPDVLSAEDLAALEAAEAWVLNPCDDTVAAAEEAVKCADFQGPGAWAAFAAISVPVAVAMAGGAGGAGAALAAAPAAATASGIAPKAVAGAVKLAAAMANGQKPEVPETTDAAAAVADAGSEAAPAAAASAGDAAKTAEALKPFIDTGKDVMEGKNTWS